MWFCFVCVFICVTSWFLVKREYYFRLCVTVMREMVRDTTCGCKYEKVSRDTVWGGSQRGLSRVGHDGTLGLSISLRLFVNLSLFSECCHIILRTPWMPTTCTVTTPLPWHHFVTIVAQYFGQDHVAESRPRRTFKGWGARWASIFGWEDVDTYIPYLHVFVVSSVTAWGRCEKNIFLECLAPN